MKFSTPTLKSQGSILTAPVKGMIYFLAFFASLFFSVTNVSAQIALANTTPVTQNFDAMAATVNLPANWRMGAQTASPTYSGASTTVTQQASSGSPSTGGTYNFGSSASERAVGAMTSGSFSSPNSLIGFFRNTNTLNLIQLTVSYDAERYRINTAAASVQFFYSLDGSSWTSVSAGDIAASSFATGASAYNFTTGTVVSKSGISITGLSVAQNSDIYLRWNLNTTGSNSQGIAIDNISVTATYPVAPTVTTTTASSITSTTASSGGNVTADGGATVTARGVAYGTSANPTVAGTKTTNGTGTGTFTSSITSLLPNTQYFYRAYATNSINTAYGSESSFTTSQLSAPVATAATAATINSFTANWGAVAGATSYRLDVSTVNNFSSFVPGFQDLTVNGTSQSVTGLSSGTTYFYRVRAFATSSTSSNSNTITAATCSVITSSAGAGGSISPNGSTTVCQGGNQTYTITPAACFSIADVVVDGVSQGATGTYSFTNVTTNHTIVASFTANGPYTITVTPGANGSITPGTGSVNCGDNATYTITPAACYAIANVVVDGVSQGAVGTYTFTNVTANHTISATFVLNTYTITVSAGANGSITPATGSVNCGDNATYTITPNACYSIADVVVDGVSQGAVGTYTFTNVTTNHTISATFVQNTHTITVSAGANGSITPATGSVNCGDNATYTITPNACFAIADVVVDGVSQGAVGTYTFTNVTANHTISATFIATNYTITVTAGANGSITPGTGSLNCGDNATYTITPAACYSIADVVVDGVSQGAVGIYTFTNVTANHTISATFVLNTYTITVSAGSNGSITPATGSVNCGDNATYMITPAACYSIADVVVDGVSQGAVGTYTFTNVTANHTISATFAIITYTATVNAGANGTITPGSATVNCGSNNTYTITANACYHIVDVTLNGVSQGAVSTLNVNNVSANYTVAATFALNTYTITVTAGANGSVTPATGSLNCGDNATYTITPAACYSIADVVVDGVSQGAVGTYTFTNVTANHTISATFVLNTYTITVSAGANGSITPVSGSVNCGDNATYTITPNACYSIADVVVDGVSQGAVSTYTFTNVTANHTISATFVLNTYTITVTAGSNGSITPATGSVNCGDNATYTITPNACFAIADVVVDGVSQGAVGTYTFTNVTANHTISATFILNTYTITATAGANGSITPATGSVNCGDNATYTITPNACYSIADVVVDGVSQGAVGTYTFTNVTANHTISATFVLNTYTITVTAGANGSITPATGSVNCGGNATYTITANACYSIADVVVDGVSQGAVGTYTFTNVTANHTISATFVLNTYTITVTAGANGSITPATGSVNCGDNATYTITPNACYSIADVVVDGVSQGAVGTYTFTNVTANHTISATFSLNTYTITVTAGANGSITPATGSVNCGDNATYTITPNACYSIADVVVDGVSQGAVSTYTFTNVTANHTISATFVLNTYTITVTAGANGSITPATGSVNCGDNATYTITPNACYSIADVVVDGVSQGAVGTYTFTNVTANHTISATFVLNTYTITVTAGANGFVTPATGSVNCGDNATYTITPNACYSIADVVVDGVSQGAVGTYTFTNVIANHTLSATFVLNTYTITVTAGANGSITPATGSVNCGANITYTITPNACYAIADVVVDGVSQGAVGTYTFTNVTANHTISATFVLTNYTITVTSGANGSITPATGSINCGDNATYTITPNACYSIADVVVDGVSQGAVGTYTFTNVTANHTISATFVATTYTITVTAGANGSITPATGSVNCGDNATYTITPNACYSIADVLVDGVSQGAVGTYTFTNVTANHTISATFVATTYTITVTAGANGSITPATGSVNCGDNATYTITPNACYSIADIVVDGVSQGAVGTYTFTNVTANHTISATFSLNTYTITVTAGANGSITPATGSVNCGANATYTITADAGYTVADVLVDGSSVGAVGSYTFTNVTANHTISATFINNASFIITSSAGANGSVSPNGATAVNSGANQSYAITPAACYHVQDVLVDGASVGAVTSYTFTNVTANHTISATFAVNAALTVSVAGPVNVCSYIGTSDQVVYTATSAGATGFTWVTPPNVTVISGAGTSTLTVTFQSGFLTQANKQLKVTALSACGNSPQFIYYLAAQAPGTPQPIVAGNSNVCSVIGTAGTITYTIAPVPGATSYNWSAQAGTTTITHPNGPGANDTIVNVSFTGSFTSSNITVSASNAGCGTSGTRSLLITRSNPSTPGLINGPTNACPNMAPNGVPATYSVAATPGVTYNWTVPSGATGLTGQGSNTISFTYPNTFVSGTITVTATNGCGTSSARSLSISKLAPATPSIIDVIQTQPCPNRIYTYTLASMPANATSVQWTIPAGSSIVSGQGTVSLTVSYPNTAVNGVVTAQSFNNCGSSTTRTTTVKLPGCPEGITGRNIAAATTVTGSNSNLDVNIYPNPTSSDFKLQVKTAVNEKIAMKISDLQGRVLKTISVEPYKTISIGADLKAGIYMVELKQGSNVKVSRVIKF